MCKICGRPDNRVMAFKGTGICCEVCRKIKEADIDHQRALDYLWSINTKVALNTHDELTEWVENG